MKENLMKAITEELEFECEIGDYKVSCQSSDTNRLIISIIDNDNEFDITTIDVRIGKIVNNNEHSVGLQVTYKKSVWNKAYRSFGTLIDCSDEVIGFLKECTISVIKRLD